MNPKKKFSLDAERTERAYRSRKNVASATDCTGLTPSAVMDEEESLAYAEMYGIHPPLPEEAVLPEDEQPL